MKIIFSVGILFISSLGWAQFKDKPNLVPELFIVVKGVVGSEQNSSASGFSGGCIHYACAVFYNPSKGIEGISWGTNSIPLDTVQTRGLYISLRQAKEISDGRTHLSYYDSLNGDLIYGKIIGISWDTGAVEITRVDSIDDVGKYTSIVTPWEWGSSIYITYYDVTNGNLKLAYSPDGQQWNLSIVDSSGDVGKYSSCALGMDNVLHISYYDATSNDLKYAKYDGSKWEISVIDSIGDVGMYSSIDVENEYFVHKYDGPVISYYDATNCNLKAAVYDSISGWGIETIDSTGDVGKYCSLTLNFYSSWDGLYRGGGIISYYDATNGDLKFAKKDDTDKWYSYIVDSIGDVGLYTHIYGNDPTYIVSYYGASDSTIRVGYHGEGGAVEEGSIVSNTIFQVSSNPFTQKTSIEFRVKSSELKELQLKIYDLSGRVIKQFNPLLCNQVIWDGTNNKGKKVPQGIYFCTLTSGTTSSEATRKTIKLTLLK
ncbi:MAG: T9SS type A sorting domain-containing protein [Candidatus Stahlbacteria bacterium]|nr:T9SS type A sorting domain-containing protein [Candidatus Stahlbacteria bacterium]